MSPKGQGGNITGNGFVVTVLIEAKKVVAAAVAGKKGAGSFKLAAVEKVEKVKKVKKPAVKKAAKKPAAKKPAAKKPAGVK